MNETFFTLGDKTDWKPGSRSLSRYQSDQAVLRLRSRLAISFILSLLCQSRSTSLTRTAHMGVKSRPQSELLFQTSVPQKTEMFRRKRGRPPKNTLGSLPSENVQASNATKIGVENLSNKRNSIKHEMDPNRKRLIHTEFIKYKAEYYTTLTADDSPPHLPTYMDSSPLNKPRYPSPSADYTQAPKFFQPQQPWILYFPRIYIETVEVSIGPFDNDQEEWRRLAPEEDGGWMAYPNGRWIQEGPGTFRWVK